MTNKEIVHTQIKLIHSLRMLRKVAPVYCLIIDISRLRIGLNRAEIISAVKELKSEGLVKVGRTINDYYVRLTTFKKEQSMKHFEEAIKSYLDQRAATDTAFAEKYKSENKSIEECCRYILIEMQKRAANGMIGCADSEVYGIAVHYYDEDDLSVAKEAPSCQVVTNREMTEEEKARIKEEAERLAHQREVEKELKRIEAQKEAEAKRAETARKKAIEKAEQKRQESEAEGQLSLF